MSCQFQGISGEIHQGKDLDLIQALKLYPVAVLWKSQYVVRRDIENEGLHWPAQQHQNSWDSTEATEFFPWLRKLTSQSN